MKPDFLYQPFIDKDKTIFVIIHSRTSGQFTGWLYENNKTVKYSFLNEINVKYFIKTTRAVPTDKIPEEVMRLFIKRVMDNGYPQS